MKFLNYKYLILDTSLLNFIIIDKETQLRYIILKYKNKDFFYNISISKDIYIYNLKKNLLILTLNKEKLNLYIRNLKNTLLSNFFKYILKIELYGVGYKMFFKFTFIYFILGYSHLIKIKIPYKCNILVKDNGKLLNLIYFNSYILGNIFYILNTLKRIDVYKGKGVRNIYKQLKLKLGKIKNLKK